MNECQKHFNEEEKPDIKMCTLMMHFYASVQKSKLIYTAKKQISVPGAGVRSEKMTGSGAQGHLQGNENVLHLDGGHSHTGIHIYQNSEL